MATIGKVIGTLFLVGVLTCAFLACFAAAYIKTTILPNADLDPNDYTMDLTSTIYYYDANGLEHVQQTLHSEEDRIWVKYDDVPQNLVNAAIAIEDRRFRTHSGVDWRRTLNGVLLMFTGQDIQGGSTITQQLLKNMTQYDDVTVKRKITEIFRALKFDKKYDKNQIMEMYLNHIYLGEGCRGVYTASYNYFNKNVSDLTLAECASLISITNNPSLYNPYISGRDEDGNLDPNWGQKNNTYRASIVLTEMAKQGYISTEERDQGIAELEAGLHFARGTGETKPTNIYSWYDEQVISDVIRDFQTKFGYSDEAAKNLLYRGGLKIYSCMNYDVQQVVDEVYGNWDNLGLVSNSGQKIQSAIVIIDQKGNVAGLAGSLGAKTINRGLNYASRTTRQPGSAFKPLSAYAPAIELGLISPASVIEDTPAELVGGKAWPNNSYGYYWGRLNVAHAVEQSSNPVAVRTIQALGAETSYQFLTERFGLTTLEPGRYVYNDWKSDIDAAPLSLGGLTDGVTVMEMAAAYSVFPRDGIYLSPKTYSKVLDANGQVLLDNTGDEGQVALKKTTTYYITNMLKRVVTGTYGTGRSANFSGQEVAGKTGSTNSNTNRWFVGYTPYYTAAVWTGYNTPERITYRDGGSNNPAITMWKLVMERIHQGLEYKDFSKPEGLKTVEICLDSGLLATDKCRSDVRGARVATYLLAAADTPTEYCEMHVEAEVCTADPVVNENGEANGQFHLAGPFCPREGNAAGVEPTVKTITLLDFERVRLNDAKTARDEAYLLENYRLAGDCTVHTTEIQVPVTYDPSTFDPTVPSTYPPAELYPDFNILFPWTWPNAGEEPPVPTPTPTPSGPEIPVETPAPTPLQETPVE